MAVGILAYGSLADEPGEAISTRTARVLHGLTTPFAVEFARSSRSRDGAPTLTVVAERGAPVIADVFVLEPSVDVIAARTMLYQRETGKNAGASIQDASWIRSITRVAGLDVCLYAALPANISSLTDTMLARLAVRSAAGPSGRRRRDGVTYLDTQLRRGVRTPLSAAYRQAILELVGATDLPAAWTKIRSTPASFIDLA